MLWKDIPHYEGVYQVSFDGQVKRVAGSVNCPSDRPLKPRIGAGGYWSVALSQYGVVKETPVHRCVASAFIGPPPSPTHQVNHKDGNKCNNNVDNLEWATPKENMLHALESGLYKKYNNQTYKGKSGELHNRSIKLLCSNGDVYYGLSEASRKLGINISTIGYAVKENRPLRNGLSFTKI